MYATPAIKIYLTRIRAIDPKTGLLKEYAGPRVQAADKEEARRILDAAELGYCEIIGRLIDIVDLEEIAQQPAPFSLKMDFDLNLN